MRFDHLPGGDLVAQGIEDLRRGEATPAALLVSVGSPRLRRAGLDIPEPIPGAEKRLYAHLAREDARTAHSRYNALIRRLVSFERALECVA